MVRGIDKEVGSDALRDESRKVRVFRFLTDITKNRLCLEEMTLPEAWIAVEELRRVSERFFPGKSHVFDMVIAPRFVRIILERFGQQVIN